MANCDHTSVFGSRMRTNAMDDSFVFNDGTHNFTAGTGLEGSQNATFVVTNGMRLTDTGASIDALPVRTNTILDMGTATKAVQLPRLTAAEIAALPGALVGGMIVYNTTTNLLNFYNGAAWGPV